MKIKIAFTVVKEDWACVLRGSPAEVDDRAQSAFKKANTGTILCSVEREVFTVMDEDKLWEEFIEVAHPLKLQGIAQEKHEIWRRKAWYLWGSPEHINSLCLFMLKHDDMIISVENFNVESKNFGNPVLN